MHDVLFLKLKKGRKLVLVALAEFADEDGYCWPSEALLAHKASIETRNLRNHLRGLEEQGWLRLEIGQGRGWVNNYFLSVGKIAQAADAQKQRIALEKQKRGYGANTSSVSHSQKPDARNIKPDVANTKPDDAADKPDVEDQKEDGSIRQNHNEPPKNRNGIVKEPTRISDSNFEKNSIPSALALPSNSPTPSPIVTETDKNKARERLCGWAKLEHSEPNFSDRQQTGLSKALADACTKTSQHELLLELWGWDFLDDAKKHEWKSRIEAHYDTVDSLEMTRQL